MKNLSDYDYEIFEEVCAQLPNMSLCEKNIAINLISQGYSEKEIIEHICFPIGWNDLGWDD